MCEEKEVNKGFSLIELLVCVAILAIISIPLLNSFLVAGKTNEKAKEIQRATTLAQNIMETVKSQNTSQLTEVFKPGNKDFTRLNLNTPYDTTNSVTTSSGDSTTGRYEFSIKRVKDGIEEYDVYITVDSALYKTAPDETAQNEYEQNNYEMPKITNLTGDKIAVIDPDTNMDTTIIPYFLNLHRAYIDYLKMTGQEVNNSFPLSDSAIKNLITKETSIVAMYGTKLDGSEDTSVINLTSKISYSISASELETRDHAGLYTEYQVFSKVFKSTDALDPLEQIYLFYKKSDLSKDVVVVNNNTKIKTILNIVDQLSDAGQSTGRVNVSCSDPAHTWKIVSNADLTGVVGYDKELVSGEDPVNRLFEVKVEVYQSDSGDRIGKKYSELVSTKEE